MHQKKFANFRTIIELIYRKNAFQEKAIKAFLEKQDKKYWKRAEAFAKKLLIFMEGEDISIHYVVDAYHRLCRDMLVERIRFQKTGKYSCRDAAHALKNVYSSETKMKAYMYGLALSQFLWPNHYAMYDFFISESRKITDVRSYLEIGPGHGFFLVESIRKFPEAKFDAIDISPVSKSISEALVKHFIGSSKCQFQVKDVNDLKSGSYDYIVMCEVLEHLDEPRSVMAKIRSLLNKSGHFFITTCANCPAIDHVYRYRSIDHIRKEVNEAGFEINSELALPVDGISGRSSEWDGENAEVNYAAMTKSM